LTNNKKKDILNVVDKKKGAVMEYVLQTHDLSKRYKGRLVLDKVNITIHKGDIYGFIGENGSGKTTLIRLITGLISANGGDFALFETPNTSPAISQARKRVGAIVETPSIYLNMSALENLKMQSLLLGCTNQERIKEVLADVGLSELYNEPKKAGNFSLGMRQRLGIAMALLGSPDFIILDEPMNGLDPAGIVEIRELILKLNREQNITFLISSHILTELSLLANTYGIISKGKILKEISAEDLKKECQKWAVIEVDDKQKLFQILREEIPVESLAPAANGVKIYGNISLNAVLNKVIQAGIEILSVNCYSSSIEDYYLSIVGGHHA